ncbi:hypothetical protein ACF0H5_009561 [Mactra antiquata]
MERAVVTDSEVADLLQGLYGLRVRHQTPLNSYDDINIHVEIEEDFNNVYISEVSTDGYVLKILNSVDSNKVDFIGAMHGAIEVVCKSGIQTSYPTPNIHGQLYTLKSLQSQTGENCMFLVRLFKFIPGELLEGKHYTLQLCYDVGQLAGQLDKALKGFHHPCLENHSRHWNLREVASLDDKIKHIEDENDRLLIRDVVEQFKTNVMNNQALTRGVIHADLNEGNILVKPLEDVSNASVEYRVTGVLDFGDLVDEFIVYEVAIAIAYMIIESTGMDIIDVAGHTLAGYLKAMELSKPDIRVLKVCICARMAQSFTYGAFERHKDPNNLYCLNTSKKGWPKLRQLWQIPTQVLFERWKQIMVHYGLECNNFSVE